MNGVQKFTTYLTISFREFVRPSKIEQFPPPLFIIIMYKLHDLCNWKKIDWEGFASNPHPQAVEYLFAHPEKIEWEEFAGNPHPEAVAYFLAHPEKINCVFNFSSNPNPQAVAYLLAHPNKINWFGFSQNPHPEAVAYLLAHPEKIDWYYFSQNSNPQAVAYLLAHRDYIYWYSFNQNSHPQAVAHLLAHRDYICWRSFCYNTNPQALEYLLKDGESVETKKAFRENIQTVEYLLSHPNKINKDSWYIISKSPLLFVLDKEKMRETKAELHQDLAKHFLHPDKIAKWIATGQEALDYPYFE